MAEMLNTLFGALVSDPLAAMMSNTSYLTYAIPPARPDHPLPRVSFREELNGFWEEALCEREHMEALIHNLPDDFHAMLALSLNLDLPACRRYYEMFGLAGHFPGALP